MISTTPELIQEFKKYAKQNYNNGYWEFVDCYTDEDLIDFFDECNSLPECIELVRDIVAKSNS